MEQHWRPLSTDVEGRLNVSRIDPTVATQYRDIVETDLPSPEKRLLAAVLADAVRTLQDDSPMRRQERMEARRWFSDKRRSGWPFTFDNVCAALNLAPSGILRRLREWLI